MREDERSGADGPFEAVDPKLTVFALANGMDLAKTDGSRRLSWFTAGLERGIRVETDADGTFRLVAMAWDFSSKESRGEALLASGMTAQGLTAALSGGIEVANGL